MPNPEFNPEFAPRRELTTDEASKGTENQESRSQNESSFLDEILQATDATDGAQNEIWKSSHEGFLDVARTFQGVDFSVDPVGQALISVVLQQTLNEKLVSEEGRLILSREIAGKLAEDPTAAPRLEAFWAKLQDAVS